MRRSTLLLAKLTAFSVLGAAGAVAPFTPVAAAAPVTTEAFTAASAFAAARKSGQRVEILSRKNATTRAWANPSGSTTAEIHAAPVRLKREGRWLDYDLTLVKGADGVIAPKVHPEGLVLSGAAGAGEHDVATVTVEGEKLGMTWQGSLPEPVLQGAKATYPQVAAGIDLVIEATSSGFEQFYIVSDRAAAARLGGLKLSMRSGRTTFAVNDDGSGQWKAADGRVLARMPVAKMWDAQGRGANGEHKRQSKVDIRKGAKAEIAPDLGWLTDPATQYPVTIDPGIVVDRAVGFDEFVQNTISISDNQSKTELKLGYADDPDCVAADATEKCRARSYLRFDGLAGYQGAKIYSARLKLWEFHSWSCTEFGWRATRTDSVAGSVQWGNEPAWREDASASNETLGWGSGCADGWVSTDVAPILDDSFASGAGSASMVIHAVGDNSRTGWSTISHNSWKKFDSSEGAHKPYIHLEYDHIPTISNVKLEGDGSCGSGAGLRKYLPLTNTNPKFTAEVKDDDKTPLPAFNVRLEVEAVPVGGGTTLTGSSPNLAPNGPAIEVRLSAPLDTSKVYVYRLRALDLYGNGSPMEYTPWTQPCELGFDAATLTSPPVVEGMRVLYTDEDGDGTEEHPNHLLQYAMPVELTFRPGAGDEGKVAAYRYGFSQVDVESPNATTVAAGPDGSAKAPVAMWAVDGLGDPLGSETLFVRAVTITGNGFNTNVIDVFQDPDVFPPAQASHVTGDVNGDGAADLAGYREISATEGLFYSEYGNNDGTVKPPVQLMRAPYVAGNSKVAQGDFNGDGKTDFAVFVANGTTNVVLKVLTSDGTALRDVEVWSSALAGTANAGKWSLSAMRVLAGDADADGKDDLVVAYANGTTNWQLKVFSAYIASGQTRFLDPESWLATPEASDLNKVKLVIGQYDNQIGADVAAFQDMGSCRTIMRVFHSGTSLGVITRQFTAAYTSWDSATTSSWCWASSQFLGGDLGGSSSSVVATYELGGCRLGVYTFSVSWHRSPPNALLPTAHWYPHIDQWWAPGGTQYWCANSAEMSLPDITGDGRGDLMLSYRCCGAYQQRVWMLAAYGPPVVASPVSGGFTYWAGREVFAEPLLKSQNAIGPIGVGSVVTDATSRYQLVSKQSGKCVSIFDGVNGGSTAESAAVKQRTCFAGYLNEQFTLEHRGASYVRLHPVHDPAKCLNVSGGLTTNGRPLIQNTCTPGQSNESWQIEYVSGLSTQSGHPNELVVRLVTNLSGKCMTLSGASMADGAVIDQWDCLPQNNQYYYLRKVAPTNDGLLVHWPIGTPTPVTTLSDATGRNAWANVNGSAATNYQSTTDLVVDGNGYGRTGGAVVNTSASFTVSAWVRLNAVGGHQTVVAQEGASFCAFYLRAQPDGKWHFELLNNINGGTYTIASTVSTTAVVSQTWVHLVGVYDKAANQGRLYVNGVPDGVGSVPAGVSASGPIVIGSAWSGAARADKLAGRINDVRLWERTLSATEIAALHATGPS